MSFKKSVSHSRLSNEGCIGQWRQDKTIVSIQPMGQCSLASQIHVKSAHTSRFQKKEQFLCEGVVHKPHKQNKTWLLQHFSKLAWICHLQVQYYLWEAFPLSWCNSEAIWKQQKTGMSISSATHQHSSVFKKIILLEWLWDSAPSD